jgi:HAD superfamily hydrolase (TIGR01509 family)
MTTNITLPPLDSLDAILLDAGGVLVNPNWDRVGRVLAGHGVQIPTARLEAAEPKAKWWVDRPENIAGIDDEKRAFLYYDLVVAGAGHEGAVPREAWLAVRDEHARSNLWDQVPAGVPEALARLRQTGRRLVVVSNANGTAPKLLESVGLAGYFDTILDSFLEGVEKPDPEIFRRALERVGVPAERALPVGDLYQVDVLGARAAGIAAALIDSGGLYPDADCPRFPSLPELVGALLA